jgi:hypothetical protein
MREHCVVNTISTIIWHLDGVYDVPESGDLGSRNPGKGFFFWKARRVRWATWIYTAVMPGSTSSPAIMLVWFYHG